MFNDAGSFAFRPGQSSFSLTTVAHRPFLNENCVDCRNLRKLPGDLGLARFLSLTDPSPSVIFEPSTSRAL
ncbi:MAG: hypothetical protein RL077_4115, partial [Verrucomicrobiota bacterium]